MAPTEQILDDVIYLLKQNPGQPEQEVTRSLKQKYALSDGAARNIWARAMFVLCQETRRRRPSRRRLKPLPGETDGGMDNIIRVLEDAAVSREST